MIDEPKLYLPIAVGPRILDEYGNVIKGKTSVMIVLIVFNTAFLVIDFLTLTFPSLIVSDLPDQYKDPDFLNPPEVHLCKCRSQAHAGNDSSAFPPAEGSYSPHTVF